MESEIIESIYGLQPNDERELPIGYAVGREGVTKIEAYTHNYGDHGIGEYHIYKGQELVASVMHRALAEIRYKQ